MQALRAAVAPFLVQTCRRDMDGGNFAMMKHSAPIAIRRWHWGGLRLAVKV